MKGALEGKLEAHPEVGDGENPKSGKRKNQVKHLLS